MKDFLHRKDEYVYKQKTANLIFLQINSIDHYYQKSFDTIFARTNTYSLFFLSSSVDSVLFDELLVLFWFNLLPCCGLSSISPRSFKTGILTFSSTVGSG